MAIIIKYTKFSLFDYESQPATIILYSEVIGVEEKRSMFFKAL